MSDKDNLDETPVESESEDSPSTSNIQETESDETPVESELEDLVSTSHIQEIDSDEIPVEIKSEEFSLEELKNLLLKEKQNVVEYKDQLKRVLADFQNLERKTFSNIENGVNTKIAQFMIDFLQIYDDFLRAKDVFSTNEINAEGLDSILKNMESLLSKYQVTPINALGEIFDPKLHEAISVVEDPSLDDDTITKEIRKGYISHNMVIRPTLVEISKKQKRENGDKN